MSADNTCAGSTAEDEKPPNSSSWSWNFYEARDDEGSPGRDFVRLSLRLAVELGTGQAIGSIRKTTRLLLQPPSRRKLWRAQRTYCRRHNDSVLPSDPLSSLPPRPRARATLESGPARAVSILRAGRLRLVRWRSRTGPGGESVSGTCICCNPLQSLNHSVLAVCSLSLSLSLPPSPSLDRSSPPSPRFHSCQHSESTPRSRPGPSSSSHPSTCLSDRTALAPCEASPT